MTPVNPPETKMTRCTEEKEHRHRAHDPPSGERGDKAEDLHTGGNRHRFGSG